MFLPHKPRAAILPPPKVIAVDVDGTLHRQGRVDAKLVEWLKVKKEAGFSLILWSSQGEAHARKAAELFGVTELFTHILSKPGYVIDDKGWSWIKFTKIIQRLSEHDAL